MTYHGLAARAAAVAFGFSLVAVGAAAAPDALTIAGSRSPALNDSGVVICRDPITGTDLDSCAGTGQDGEFGRDIAHSKQGNGLLGFNFSKICNNGHEAGTPNCPKSGSIGTGPKDWGCTFDHVSGLTWELRPTDGTLRDPGRTYSDENNGDDTDASGLIAYLNQNGVCGATDWRLPLTTELFGLTAQADGGAGGYLDTNWFPDTVGVVGWLWTADVDEQAPGRAWVVKFSDATTGVNDEQGVDFPTGVRAVSGIGYGTSGQRFVAKGAQVRDTATGLVWRRCVEGMSWNSRKSSCVGDDQRYVWSDALSHAIQQAMLTGKGWRLPNVKELQSLIVPAQPMLIDPTFPQSPRFLFWSSTWGGSDNPNTVDFSDGLVQGANAADLQTPLNVRLVRDGN